MRHTSKIYERLGVVATVDPVNGNNTETLGDAVDMAKFHRVLFVLLLGANDSTVDFKLTEAATSGGSYSDISGKAITQQTGGDDDNKQFLIEVAAEELTDGKRYVKPSVTCGNGTTNLVAVVALGEPRYLPVTDYDLSSVGQIV